MKLCWMLPEVLAEMGWTAYRLHRESSGTLSLRRFYDLADPDHRPKYVAGDVLGDICSTLDVTPNDLWRFKRDAQGAKIRPTDELCDRHAGRGWSEGIYCSGEWCPKCRAERGASRSTVGQV